MLCTKRQVNSGAFCTKRHVVFPLFSTIRHIAPPTLFCLCLLVIRFEPLQRFHALREFESCRSRNTFFRVSEHPFRTFFEKKPGRKTHFSGCAAMLLPPYNKSKNGGISMIAGYLATKNGYWYLLSIYRNHLCSFDVIFNPYMLRVESRHMFSFTPELQVCTGFSYP